MKVVPSLYGQEITRLSVYLFDFFFLPGGKMPIWQNQFHGGNSLLKCCMIDMMITVKKYKIGESSKPQKNVVA